MSLIHIGFDHLPGVGASDKESKFNHAITRINNKYRMLKIKVQSTKSHVEIGGGRVKLVGLVIVLIVLHCHSLWDGC